MEEWEAGRGRWMKRWIKLWSSLQETALLSTAKPANSVRVCSVLPSEPHASSQMCVCDGRAVCPREREVCCRPLWLGRCSPPSALPSCLLSCCELNVLRDAALSAYLTLSLCPFPHSLPHLPHSLDASPSPLAYSSHHPPTS